MFSKFSEHAARHRLEDFLLLPEYTCDCHLDMCVSVRFASDTFLLLKENGVCSCLTCHDVNFTVFKLCYEFFCLETDDG